MNPVALIDMDGTLADYAGAMRRDLEVLQGPVDPGLHELEVLERTYPYMRARMDMIKRQPDWWQGLEVLPEGFEVVSMLRKLDYKLHILTKGPKRNVDAWTQKAKWCQRWIPDAEITITLDKGLVYGRVLVDDWPDYIDAWLAHRPRGLVVMPNQPWNQGYRHPQVMRLVAQNHIDVQANRDSIFAKLADQRNG